MSVWSDLRPSAIIPYSLSRIHISTAWILCVLCPILVHVYLGSSVSFSPFFLIVSFALPVSTLVSTICMSQI
jgi:hypothetical protein